MSETSVRMLKSPPSHMSSWEEEFTIKGSTIGNSKLSNDINGEGASSSHVQLLVNTRSSRLYNTMNFIHNEGLCPIVSMPNVESMSSEEQEVILTQELLYLLTGTESCLITTHHVPPNQISFTVDVRVEQSLKELTLQIAQLAVHYHSVTRYVENWNRFEHGQVNQALAASMREILKDYFVLLSQTETLHTRQELTLQKMWFFIHPTLQVMAILSSIVVDIEQQNCRGGNVLTLLHNKAVAMVGDAIGQNLCFDLAQKASTPYFIILENWIYKGMIKDPFSEFFVLDSDKDAPVILEANDNYWENRYKLVPENCPVFLNKVNQQILKAGKYLNVIRQCGKDVCITAYSKINYSIHERVYVGVIEKAYAFASKTLLDLLLNEYDLMRRLKSVKHYMLMDQGDFIVQFLDLTENELSKQVNDMNEVRLGSLLELALRTSSSATDPYKDSVHVVLFISGISEQMLSIMRIETPLEDKKIQCDDFNFPIPGVEGFSLSYKVTWPISLVLHPRVIICYQMIFRHLFFCKHVERQLCKVWIAKKSFKDSNLSNDPEKAAAFSLRQKMLNFVQNLQYYMAFEVIEPAWDVFLNTMSKVTDVDQVLNGHVLMVNSILDDSMLTSPSLLARMTTLLSLCLQFTQKILGSSSVDESTSSNLSHLAILSVSVEELTTKFNRELVDFLREVSTIVQNPNQSSKVANIIYRVNFNGFYTEALEHGIDTRLSINTITNRLISRK